ncbi:MAG: CDP-glycerol glycerophosphotransferase family protein, partial [Acutalibacteraceae bacterium]
MRRLRFLCRAGLPHIEEKTVVFAAYGGRSYACSPKAIYEYMRDTPEYGDFTLIWLFKDPERYRFLEAHPRTKLCAFGSSEADRAAARAKYWVFNFMVPDEWVPRREQVYVQCWHGTPLKKLGLDLVRSENAMNSVREIHARYRENAKKLDYLLSPSPFASAAFTTAWGLRAAQKAGAVLELGYPRNDFLAAYTQRDAARIRERLGLSGCEKRILLYAPTWRDDQYDPKKGYT